MTLEENTSALIEAHESLEALEGELIPPVPASMVCGHCKGDDLELTIWRAAAQAHRSLDAPGAETSLSGEHRASGG